MIAGEAAPRASGIYATGAGTPVVDAPGAAVRGSRARVPAVWRSSKTYGHEEGLSCCFRQWRASHSHCRLLHGYALSFRLTFASTELDACNWCFDFGGLKPVKIWLHEMFDHTLLVAADDPGLAEFRRVAELGIAELRVLSAVGCEAVARHVFEHVSRFVDGETGGRVWLEEVEVREHAGNSAAYAPDVEAHRRRV